MLVRITLIRFVCKERVCLLYTSFNRQDDSGVTPEQSLNKTNLTLRATSFLDEAKKWKVDAKVNYVNQNAHNRPIIGINPSNAFSTVYNLPRSLNVLDFENCVDCLLYTSSCRGGAVRR